MARVPSEKTRYAALGGVIVGTATIAGFSMWMALSQALGGVSAWTLLPAAIWALFVLNLDRWLVATSAGSAWHRRIAMYLPRLAVAFVFGVIIAEPLVLRIFHTAIEQHVQDGRDGAVDDLRSALVRCNPEPGSSTVPSGQDCGPYQFSFEETPRAATSELASRQAEATALQSLIDADQRRKDELRDLAVDECNGAAGPGRTGVPGVGRECRDRRAAADEFDRTNPIEENTAKLGQLKAHIIELQSTVGDASRGYQETLDAKIAERLDEMKANQGKIGLLERFQALSDLVSTNTFLLMALWAIRIFFILIDCLPVIVKFFSGVTPYDRLIDQRLETAHRIHSAEEATKQITEITELELVQHEVRNRGEQRRSEADLGLRRQQATLRAQLTQDVENLTSTMLNGSQRGGRGTSSHPLGTNGAETNGVPVGGQPVDLDRSY